MKLGIEDDSYIGREARGGDGGQPQKENASSSASLESSTEDPSSSSTMTARITLQSLTQEQTERILERFPLTQVELGHLHQSYSKFCESGGDFSKVTLSAIVLLSEHDEDDSDSHTHKLGQVETKIVPECSQIFQCALESTFVVGCTEQDDVRLWEFLEAVLALCGRRGSSSLLDILYDVATTVGNDNNSQKSASSTSLISLLHRLAQAACFLKTNQENCHCHTNPPPDSLVQSVSLKAQQGQRSSGNTLISRQVWRGWIQTTTPQVHQILSTFAHYAVFGPSHSFRSASSLPLLRAPLVDGDSVVLRGPCNSLSVSLALLSPELAGSWKRLYLSDSDGFSFETFERALLAYSGSTLLLIRTTSASTDDRHEVFGFYTDCPWRISNSWYGEGSNSFLFTLSPILQYFAPVGTKPFHMRLHNAPTTRGDVFQGLGIGGINSDTPRVHITRSFEQCKAGAIDGVYESGPLLSDGNIFFDIDVLEVWAIDSSEEALKRAMEMGKAAEAIREGRRLSAARVDRKQFLDDFQSGVIENSLFDHREQARGRHSFCADNDGRGYYVDDKAPSSGNILKK